jgi:hypothetical protein
MGRLERKVELTGMVGKNRNVSREGVNNWLGVRPHPAAVQRPPPLGEVQVKCNIKSKVKNSSLVLTLTLVSL